MWRRAALIVAVAVCCQLPRCCGFLQVTFAPRFQRSGLVPRVPEGLLQPAAFRPAAAGILRHGASVPPWKRAAARMARGDGVLAHAALDDAEQKVGTPGGKQRRGPSREEVEAAVHAALTADPCATVKMTHKAALEALSAAAGGKRVFVPEWRTRKLRRRVLAARGCEPAADAAAPGPTHAVNHSLGGGIEQAPSASEGSEMPGPASAPAKSADANSTTAPMLVRPVGRDVLMDKVEFYRERLLHALRLEEAAQEHQVMARLRKCTDEELESQGVAVLGLSAQPSGELFGDKVLELTTTLTSGHWRRGEDWVFRRMAVGDMVLVTRGAASPLARRAGDSVQGIVVEKGSGFLQVALPRWPQGVWQARRDRAGGPEFRVDAFFSSLPFERMKDALRAARVTAEDPAPGSPAVATVGGGGGGGGRALALAAMPHIGMSRDLQRVIYDSPVPPHTARVDPRSHTPAAKAVSPSAAPAAEGGDRRGRGGEGGGAWLDAAAAAVLEEGGEAGWTAAAPEGLPGQHGCGDVAAVAGEAAVECVEDVAKRRRLTESQRGAILHAVRSTVSVIQGTCVCACVCACLYGCMHACMHARTHVCM